MTATLIKETAVNAYEKAAPAPRLLLAGAAPDTGNLGVSALSDAVVEGLLERLPCAQLTVFDFGDGLRREAGAGGEYWRCGAKHSRRFYRPETMWNIRVSAKLGGLNNPAARRVLEADAALDISGGDSFSDLYGAHRFRAVALTKLLALEHEIPLVLLPQTYGPFQSDRMRRIAAVIVGGCAMAWARDARSFESLRDLLEDRFDPQRHRCGVDVAFGLREREPRAALDARLCGWLERETGRELIGVNVSGLVFNDAEDARAQYGLRADYRAVVVSLVRRLLMESDANVVLVPHVVTAPGHYESDADACGALRDAFRDLGRERLAVAPAFATPGEAKWLIGRTDWFCATRMHSAIAASSSGVPTAAAAYSVKTLGVFETCGQGGHVADLRTENTGAVVERLWRSWENRHAARRSLRRALPATLAAAGSQMDTIAEACAAMATRREGRA